MLAAGRTQAELISNEGEKIVFLQLRRDDVGDDGVLRIEFSEQRLNERGLAGADIAGDDDETITLPEPVLQKRQRALVLFARERRTVASGESWNGFPDRPKKSLYIRA